MHSISCHSLLTCSQSRTYATPNAPKVGGMTFPHGAKPAIAPLSRSIACYAPEQAGAVGQKAGLDASHAGPD